MDVVTSIEWKEADEMYWVVYGIRQSDRKHWIEVPYHAVKMIWVEECDDG